MFSEESLLGASVTGIDGIWASWAGAPRLVWRPLCPAGWLSPQPRPRAARYAASLGVRLSSLLLVS